MTRRGVLNLKYFMSEKTTTMICTEAINFLKAAIGISPQKYRGQGANVLEHIPNHKLSKILRDSFSLTVSTVQSTSTNVLQDGHTL